VHILLNSNAHQTATVTKNYQKGN